MSNLKLKRDEKTTAILNTNNTELQQYKKTRRKMRAKNKRIDDLEERINKLEEIILRNAN